MSGELIEPVLLVDPLASHVLQDVCTVVCTVNSLCCDHTGGPVLIGGGGGGGLIVLVSATMSTYEFTLQWTLANPSPLIQNLKPHSN